MYNCSYSIPYGISTPHKIPPPSTHVPIVCIGGTNRPSAAGRVGFSCCFFAACCPQMASPIPPRTGNFGLNAPKHSRRAPPANLQLTAAGSTTTPAANPHLRVPRAWCVIQRAPAPGKPHNNPNSFFFLSSPISTNISASYHLRLLRAYPATVRRISYISSIALVCWIEGL